MQFPGRQLTSSTLVTAATVLTSSYVSGIISSDEGNALNLLINYVPGDETSIQIKVEATNDLTSPSSGLSASSSWYQQITQNATGGTVTIVPAIYSLTTSGLANPTKIAILINPVKGSGFRVSWKATAGTPTGTIGIQAFMGWV